MHSYDAKPEDHWKVSEPADHVVVFGLQAKATGIWVPNELIADYVKQHPEKLEGWASVDPNEPDCIEQLVYCVKELGLKGLKLGPTYQHFDPQDRKHWPFFAKAQELELPIMWHQGTTFPSKARLKWSLPLQLEDMAMDFPDLKMIIAHLGPSVGRGLRRAGAQMPQPLYRYFGCALSPLALLASDDDGDGIWHHPQNFAGLRLPLRHDLQCDQRPARRQQAHRR